MAENQDLHYADDVQVGDQDLEGVQLFQDIDPDNATPDQVRQMIKTGKTLLVQKKNWREKAQKPAAPAPEPAKPLPTNNAQPADQPDPGERIAKLEVAEEKRQFGFRNNLSPEETDYIFAFAQGTGQKPSEVLDHPFIKNGLTALRAENRANGATPAPSGRSPKVEGKTFGQMKPEERAKSFPDIVAGLQRK